jgi:hypothetical protein
MGFSIGQSTNILEKTNEGINRKNEREKKRNISHTCVLREQMQPNSNELPRQLWKVQKAFHP